MLIGILVFIILLLVIVVVGRIIYLISPTKGEPIANYKNPKTALVVIDVQNDTLNIPQFKNTDELMKNINSAIECANNLSMDVIYIKQEYISSFDRLFSGGKYKSGSTGANLYTELDIVSNNIFSKYRADSFSVNGFEQYLIDNEIDTIYIVGAEASACVYKTALGGINRGYKITIVENGLFSISEKAYNKIKLEYEKAGISVQSDFSPVIK